MTDYLASLQGLAITNKVLLHI